MEDNTEIEKETNFPMDPNVPVLKSDYFLKDIIVFTIIFVVTIFAAALSAYIVIMKFF